MNLTYEQIASIAQGVAYVEQKEEGIQFHRFTSVQEKGYDGSNYHPKQYATAGVRLHFKTDSKSLYMKVLTSMGSSRKFFAHDVLVNGELIGSLKNSTEEAYGEFEKTFSLGDGTTLTQGELWNWSRKEEKHHEARRRITEANYKNMAQRMYAFIFLGQYALY